MGLEATAPSIEATILVVARAAEGEVREAGAAAVAPSHGQTWTSGPFSNRSVGLGPMARQLTADYPTTPGHPILQTRAPHKATISGEFTVYVWGPNVTVISDDGREVFRSGAWYDNVTGPQVGPRGATRTDYWQLVRIDVTEGTAAIEHEAGHAQWVAPAMMVENTGIAAFVGAEGALHSKTKLYELGGRELSVTGVVRLSVSPGKPGTASLASRVDANAATISVPASATIPAPGAAIPGLAWPLLMGLAGAATALALAARRWAWWPY
ncbi:MAG: hypothetical protein HYT80_00120, partial [Euryarchaeota archaeon]|nr:hypothetical protein [Euryarchaeota archaeon]